MVIERALNKLKAARAVETPTPGVQPTARAPESASPEAPTIARPVFFRLECDRECAMAHRIALPDTPLAEDERVSAAYRMVRTRLLQRMRANHWSTLAITSPEAGEGKSVTAINLALNFARHASHDVFLLDMDMRSPSVCAYLGVQPKHQITDYFAGTVGPNELFFSIGPENLAIAASVKATAQASELLTQSKIAELLDYIKRISDNPVILIDLAPVTVTDEALAVAPRVDAMMLVVAERKTRRDSLTRAKQLLADFPCAGIVLNRSTEASRGGGYYYYLGNA